MMKYLRAVLERKKTLVLIASVLGGVILLSVYPGTGAISDETAPEGAGGTTPAPDMTAMSVKLIGSVALVIGLLYAALYAMRRFAPGFRLAGVRENAISVVHKRHIAPKKAIYILKVGRRAMVVGVTDSQINHLADLSDEDLESIEVEEKPGGNAFKRYLFGTGPGPKSRS